jgi:hypothetical protein
MAVSDFQSLGSAYLYLPRFSGFGVSPLHIFIVTPDKEGSGRARYEVGCLNCQQAFLSPGGIER